jgi:SAM-dependent methyltransferase
MFKDAGAIDILKWILRKKTITRSLMNSGLRNYQNLSGRVVDLGGGGESSYKKLISFSGTYINMDASEEAKPTVVGNLEERHPFPDGYADTILLLNVLEHVYDYKHVVSEMKRCLKPGGKVIVFVPFLMPYHTFKTKNFFIDDYFRYTQSSLSRIFTECGFLNVHLKPVGGLFIVIANFACYVLKYRIFQVPFVFFCILAETVFKKIKPDSAKKYPIGYFLEAS